MNLLYIYIKPEHVIALKNILNVKDFIKRFHQSMSLTSINFLNQILKRKSAIVFYLIIKAF